MTYEDKLCHQIPHLRRYARVLCGDADLADDLVQECMERALKRRHLWQPRLGIRPWLLKMIYRLYLNNRQSAFVRRERPTDDMDTKALSFANQEASLEYHRALTLLDTLPDTQRNALMLVVLEGLDYKQASKILGIPIGTLRSRIARARETLRQKYEDGTHQAPASSAASLRRIK